MSNPAASFESVDVVKHHDGGKHPTRVGTVVWGAVVMALGVLIILTRQAGLALDAGQTAIWLLFGAGIAMVTGGAIHLIRRNKM